MRGEKQRLGFTMAIQYLFPLPEPVLAVDITPEALAALPAEIREKVILNTKSITDLIRDLGQHQVFTRPKGQEIWDAVELALEDRQSRLELDPTGPDYIALPSQILAVLNDCLDKPNFWQPTDEGSAWTRGLPYPNPAFVRKLRAAGFFACLKNPKQGKPVKVVKPDPPAPEVVSAALAVPETEALPQKLPQKEAVSS